MRIVLRGAKDGLECERRSENWTSRKRHDREKKYSSDVNIWLVSDLVIITSDQHCQFLCRMSKLPNSSKLDQDGSTDQYGESDFLLINVLSVLKKVVPTKISTLGVII